jgi:hypothetical protein
MKADFIKRINFGSAFNDNDFVMVMVMVVMPVLVMPVMFSDDYNLRGVRRRRQKTRDSEGQKNKCE